MGRFHQAHSRKHPQGSGFVGCGGDDAPPDVVAQTSEVQAAIGLGCRLVHAATANDDRLAAQFGVMQEFDGGEKSIHVEMGNTPLP
ncbi:hypothetical protein SDC9_181091 [bioreactor metagenome]|uniref:Uncharacterized protein n=1 Tax=bioreactor metagenome TaxID=1076179 RepID=A0A645H5I3_9ZZZZ